tara:strand:+ start:158 stop:667 length:510 start_codon:yes stop_codon:yes gene_type:complete
MSYFNQLPKIKFLNQDIVNLATSVKLHKLIKADAFALLNYVIKDGESPDTVAFNYYSDPSYAWLVLLSNNIIDPYFEWPLSVYDFTQFIKKKYGSIPAAQAITIHCEHNTKDITVSADSLTVSNGVSSGDYTAVDAYTYWDKVNENRKFIKLVNVSYLAAVTEQFNNLV